jgi:CrcB protein
MTYLVIALGGALGAVSRYASSSWVQTLTGASFPWGTLGVNVVGSLALGFLMVWLQSTASSTEVRDLVTVGFLGSFTTFSTFSYETVTMLRDGSWWRAGGYTVGSVALGLLAVVLGAAIATGLTQARS